MVDVIVPRGHRILNLLGHEHQLRLLLVHHLFLLVLVGRVAVPVCSSCSSLGAHVDTLILHTLHNINCPLLLIREHVL